MVMYTILLLENGARYRPLRTGYINTKINRTELVYYEKYISNIPAGQLLNRHET